MKNEHLEYFIKQFDSFGDYLDKKIERDIEENRKGAFVLNFKDKEGNPLKNVSVKVRQVSHEFKFGCTLFNLEQFPDKEKNDIYKNQFKNLFNYGVVPLYWNTLEPNEGKPRFEKDCEFISRRPPIDTIMEFCTENNIRTKGHCLVYNAFQPDWIPESNREIKIKIDNRMKAISERYGNQMEDYDVINEMLGIYKNCYKGNGTRNLQVTDESDHEKWSFETAKRHFPHSRLFWNEGVFETFGNDYRGHRSFYYMEIERMLKNNVKVEGIGMQYHAFITSERALNLLKPVYNPLRIIDVFECYEKLGLPIQISEVSIPSLSNNENDEQLQAELTKRLYRLWFGRKHCDAIVWWNLADNTALASENRYHAGLLREDCSTKPAYKEIEKLIKQEWTTSFETKVSDELRFSGFYGDYEIEITHDGKTKKENLRLFKENTGYDNRLCDFRKKEIVL